MILDVTSGRELNVPGLWRDRLARHPRPPRPDAPGTGARAGARDPRGAALRTASKAIGGMNRLLGRLPGAVVLTARLVGRLDRPAPAALATRGLGRDQPGTRPVGRRSDARRGRQPCGGRRLADVGGLDVSLTAGLGGQQPDHAAGRERGQPVDERVDEVAVALAPPQEDDVDDVLVVLVDQRRTGDQPRSATRRSSSQSSSQPSSCTTWPGCNARRPASWRPSAASAVALTRQSFSRATRGGAWSCG